MKVLAAKVRALLETLIYKCLVPKTSRWIKWQRWDLGQANRGFGNFVEKVIRKGHHLMRGMDFEGIFLIKETFQGSFPRADEKIGLDTFLMDFPNALSSPLLYGPLPCSILARHA